MGAIRITLPQRVIAELAYVGARAGHMWGARAGMPRSYPRLAYLGATYAGHALEETKAGPDF